MSGPAWTTRLLTLLGPLALSCVAQTDATMTVDAMPVAQEPGQGSARGQPMVAASRLDSSDAAMRFDCPQDPIAYVFELSDGEASGEAEGSASRMLRDAGFVVRPLPLDESPLE